MAKGQKTGGRKPKSLNKIPRDLRLSITDFLNEKFEEVVNEFDKLEGKDKLNFYKDLLGYAVPKLNSTVLKPDIEEQKKSTFDLFPPVEKFEIED